MIFYLDLLLDFLVENWVTIGYIGIQFILLLGAIVVLQWKRGWHTHTNTAASILTIIGVLGTFGGIFGGLWGFEAENIERSVPDLLNGLKLAFLTSIVGISSAIVLKIRAFCQATKSPDSDEDTIQKFVEQLTTTLTNVQTSGEINLLAQMVTLNTAIREEGKETRTALDGIKEGLTGIHTSLTGGQNETITQLRGLTTTVSDKHNHLTSTVAEKSDNLIRLQTEEGNKTREKLTELQTTHADGQSDLSTQLENLATTFSTQHDLLIDEFQIFSQNVAESVARLATDELVEALREVISGFNENLTEQFGENFRHLNEAVDKTVAWQEQYRQQMDELANEFRIAAASIERSRESVALIAESSNTIAERSESIVACTETLDPILHTLNDHLDAFSALRQRALEAFPLIERRLDELTTDFSSAVQTAIRESHENVEAQRDALLEQSVLLESIVNRTTENMDQLTTNFSQSVNTSIEQSHDSINRQREALTQRFSELESAAVTVSQQLQESINGIGSQLDDVFEESRNQIAQLTTGFAQNLTQQLENTLNSITTDFLDTVETTIADSQASMEQQRTALNAHSSTLQTTINDVSQQIDGIMEGVSNTVNGSQSSMDQQRQDLSRLTQQLQSNFRTLEGTLEAVLKASLNSLASTHGESLRNLGENLAALSEKFVADYTPLTEELDKLVRIARNNQINNERDVPN